MERSGNSDILWNWRVFFSRQALQLGENDANQGKMTRFEADKEGRWAHGVTDGGFTVAVIKAPANIEDYLKYPDWRQLKTGRNVNPRLQASNYFSCSCSQGKLGTRCRHLACLMFVWEKQHGPFVITEDKEARKARLERERQEIEKRLRAENEKRLKEEKQKNRFAASEYFQNRVSPAPKELYFNPDDVLKRSNLQTNQYEAELADQLVASGDLSDLHMTSGYTDTREQCLSAEAEAGQKRVSILLNANRICNLSCDCGRSSLYDYGYWHDTDNARVGMCCHALAVWRRLREALIRENPGDATDYKGAQLLSLMTGAAASSEDSSAALDLAIKKREALTLVPRIVSERMSDALKLAFDLGRADGKAYAVKSLEGLVNAVDSQEDYALTKTTTIRFAEEAFTEASMKWYQLITSRVRSVQSVNSKLNSNYYYHARRLAVGAGIPLEESDLDIVYDMTEGGEILYQYGTRAEAKAVRVGQTHPTVELRFQPVMSGKRLTGVRIEGSMPRLLQGARHQYMLDMDRFGRVTDDEMDSLAPFRAIADGTGAISCLIGEKKFAEFYYRVLPALRDMPQVRLVDQVCGIIEEIVPPEPQFTFYIDLDEDITCVATVRYGEDELPLGGELPSASNSERDRDQEARVLLVLRQFFPREDREQLRFCRSAGEDDLVRILTDGVNTLSRYGTVKGSEAFQRVHILPAPQPRFSVQIEGGLLDLSIRTKDLSEEELLELLASYRQRRRWHRLGNGDFIDLTDTSALDDLDEAARAMDVSLEELARDGVRVPKFRALYVDRLLEAHNDIATSRDRHFKALVRSFQTIRDSDFEAPEALTDVLRAYQLYGFRWLSTLSQAGFGGILADEMGLGKTVQMLAYIQALRDQGEQKPALVVCPASLVYNWKEECRKFTPDLAVQAVAGTLAKRKAQLKGADSSVDLYITSYDLLKRDITLYDGMEFSVVVLDEAQYVKNQRAAVSKAVRVLKADHRFALTGTPIENRLSELWSIFDFLMPGFLYSASEFATRFEGPIMKQKDAAATATLARMTEPFILRRKKTDVLKDLPEKLEESRRAEMAEDQRRLYDAQLVRMKNLLETSGESGEDKLRILAEITRLRQICCDPSLIFEDYSGSSTKREACLELIQNAMDAGHRMLVFSQFTTMLELLAADLKREGIPFYTLTGATGKQERIRLVNEFNGGDVPVFLISLKAGGTGLNLVGADVVIHYDPWWNLAVQNQATDRAHRIGQTKQVTVVKLIAAETIEEKIVELQQTKRDLAEAILTGQNTSLMSLSREELLALLE